MDSTLFTQLHINNQLLQSQYDSMNELCKRKNTKICTLHKKYLHEIIQLRHDKEALQEKLSFQEEALQLWRESLKVAVQGIAEDCSITGNNTTMYDEIRLEN